MAEPGSNAEVVVESLDSPLSSAEEDRKVIEGLKQQGLLKDRAPVEDPEEPKPPKEPKPKEPKAEVTTEPVKEEKKEEPPKPRSMDLVHQARERARLEREQKQRETDLEAEVERRVQQRLQSQQRQTREPEDAARLKQMAIQNPMAFYRSLGADPNDIMTVIAAHELGKDVPAHLKPLQHQMSLKTQTDETIEKLTGAVEKLQGRVDSYEQRQQTESLRSEVRGEIKSFLTTIPERLNLVQKQYERNSSRALEKIWDLTEQYARLYPDDPILAPEEAAELYQSALEEELGPWLEELKAKKETTPPPPPEKPEPRRQVSSSDVAGRSSTKDELPFEDDEKLNDILAGRLKRGVHLPKRQ